MEDYQLFRSLKGQTTAAEERRVHAWRGASPERERSYQELAVVLDAVAAAKPRLDTEAPSVFSLIHAAETAAQAAERERPDKRRLAFGLVVVAAALVLGFALGLWRTTPFGTGAVHTEEIVTGEAEGATLTLGDGTVVRLGPASRLRLVGGSAGRRVTFQGLAFFAVAHDPRRPFRIETRAGDIEVLGTRFHLETRAEDLAVTVVDGWVRLASRAGSREVGRGQQGRVRQGTILPAVPVSDLAAASRGLGKVLVFQATPLAEAAREIEALYGVQIEILDERIGQQTLTTWFVDESIGHVLRIFCLVAEAKCTTTGDHTTVARKDAG